MDAAMTTTASGLRLLQRRTAHTRLMFTAQSPAARKPGSPCFCLTSAHSALTPLPRALCQSLCAARILVDDCPARALGRALQAALTTALL